MPPLSVEMNIGERHIKLPDVTPGMPASITDMGDSSPSVLILSCNPEDEGGIVYRQIPEDSYEVFRRTLRVVRSKSGIIEAVIGKDETINLTLTTKVGKATLAVKHY